MDGLAPLVGDGEQETDDASRLGVRVRGRDGFVEDRAPVGRLDGDGEVRCAHLCSFPATSAYLVMSTMSLRGWPLGHMSLTRRLRRSASGFIGGTRLQRRASVARETSSAMPR